MLYMITDLGVWFMHCHLELHTTWGLKMAFLVEDGTGSDESILPPPNDLPACWLLINLLVTSPFFFPFIAFPAKMARIVSAIRAFVSILGPILAHNCIRKIMCSIQTFKTRLLVNRDGLIPIWAKLYEQEIVGACTA